MTTEEKLDRVAEIIGNIEAVVDTLPSNVEARNKQIEGIERQC